MTSMRRRVLKKVRTGGSAREMSLMRVIGDVGGVGGGLPSGGGSASGAAVIIGIGGRAYVGISMCLRRRLIRKLEVY